MDLMDLMSSDAEEFANHAPTDSELMSISELATEQSRLEDEIARDEAALKEKQEAYRLLSEVKLPAAMAAVNMSAFKLEDGRSITVKEEVMAAITKENEAKAFEWLERTGNDGIIKSEFKVPFGKGQEQEAKQLNDLLANFGASFTRTRGVHYQTLRAFVKKQLEAGSPIPTDTFSIFVKKVAKIK